MTPSKGRTRAAVAALWLLATSALGAQQAADSVRPLSLEEALQLAVPASEALGLARVGIKRAHGSQLQARSELFPQLTGTASYSRLLKSQYQGLFSSDTTPVDTTSRPTTCARFAPDPTRPLGDRLQALEDAVQCSSSVNPFGSFGNLPFGRANTYNFGLSASQTLFAGGRVRAQIGAANATRRSAEIGLTAAGAQLVLDVVQGYYDAALTDQLLSIAEGTLAQAETTFVQTRLRREVGTQPEFDLLRAQVARDNQRPVVIQRRTQRDIAYLRLKQLLNLPLEQRLQLTTELRDTTVSRIPSLAKVVTPSPDTSTDHRSSVRQAVETVKTQEARERVTRAQQFPALTLSSDYGKVAYPSGALPSWNDLLTNWSVAVGLRIPLFTGGRIRGEKMMAQASTEEARLRLQQTRESAQLDARNTLAQLEAAQASWVASEGTATQARRAHEIAALRYREGISTQTELLDARISLEQALVNRAQAARDVQVARVRAGLLADLPLGQPGAGAATSSESDAPARPAQPQPTPSANPTTGQPGGTGAR